MRFVHTHVILFHTFPTSTGLHSLELSGLRVSIRQFLVVGLLLCNLTKLLCRSMSPRRSRSAMEASRARFNG